MKLARGPLMIIVTICATKQFSASIDIQNLQNQMVLLRMGMEAVTAGNQVMSGKRVTADMVGVYADELYDEVSKTSVTDDASVQHELGNDGQGVDLVANARPGKDNQKPWFFRAVDDLPTAVSSFIPGYEGPALGDLCEALNTIGEAVTSIPPFSWAFEAMHAISNGIVERITQRSIDEWVQAATDYFSTGSPDTLAQGALRGGLANTGLRIAVSDQFQAMGGRELTDAEGATVAAAVKEDQRQTFARASIYDRYFNMYESKSVMATTLAAVPTSRVQLFHSVEKLPGNMGTMLSRALGINKAFAQTAPTFSYGFPLYGYSVDEMQNPDYEDPYANETYMLEGDRLERMNQQYGQECFHMQVTREGNLEYGETGDFLLIPDKCKDTGNVELTHYRFYLADMITGHTMACFDGEEDSCTQLGFNGGTPATATGTTGTQITGDLFAASDTMTCTVGTDGGVQDGYNKGTLVRIRICNVPTGAPGKNIAVNARIAANVASLYSAAKAAGVTMNGGGFRTMAGQQSTYNNNCNAGGGCNPPTAKPGFSNHQMGLAIDFSPGTGGGTIGAGSSEFNWLKANAATYGLQNLPSESWHWSVDGG